MRGSVHYSTEEMTVNVAVDGHGPEELRLIEDVESFQPKLQRFCFRQVDISHQREIGVEHPRPVEEPARGVARRTQGIDGKQRGIEIRLAIRRIRFEV